MEATVTKQGVRNLNGLGPQRKRPPRDELPQKERGAATPPTAKAAHDDQTAVAPLGPPDKT
jgi:hypothetical protein